MMGGEVRKRVATTDRLGVVYLLQPQRLNGRPIDRSIDRIEREENPVSANLGYQPVEFTPHKANAKLKYREYCAPNRSCKTKNIPACKTKNKLIAQN